MLHTPICDLLGIRLPILQGALGPHDTTGLALAVSRAGGLGMLSSIHGADVYQDTKKQIATLDKAGAVLSASTSRSRVRMDRSGCAPRSIRSRRTSTFAAR